jgi:dTDP-glucose pyrophosphorylase
MDNHKINKIDIKSVTIKISDTIKDAMQSLVASGQRIVLVVDAKNKLRGILTDGDIRKFLLKNNTLEASVSKCMNTNPVVLLSGVSKKEVELKMSQHGLSHIPLLDSSGKVLELMVSESADVSKITNTVVIMAGGQGVRLRPLTENIPKPLLKIKDKPMLQIIIERLIAQGFCNFILTVNYKKEMIMDYFGNGSNFGINIKYIEEDRPMGTAGSLSLLKNYSAPIMVMNGDILTKANFRKILNHHLNNNTNHITMVVRPHEYKISYGVVKHKDGIVTNLEEKPVKTYYFNAGIYALSKEALEQIPEEHFDMTMLIKKMNDIGKHSSIFVLNDYWLDIGQIHDYDKAKSDYDLIFND